MEHPLTGQRPSRDRDVHGGLAVVAGDSIVADRAAPWPRRRPSEGAPHPRRTRPGAAAPTGFVPLAVLAVAFLALPLMALVVRAPWRHLPAELTAPRRSSPCPSSSSPSKPGYAPWTAATRMRPPPSAPAAGPPFCLLYTSDAADEEDSVD